MQIIPNAGPPRTFDQECGTVGAFSLFVEKKQNAIAKMNRDVDARIRIANAKNDTWGNVCPPDNTPPDGFPPEPPEQTMKCAGLEIVSAA